MIYGFAMLFSGEVFFVSSRGINFVDPWWGVPGRRKTNAFSLLVFYSFYEGLTSLIPGGGFLAEEKQTPWRAFLFFLFLAAYTSLTACNAARNKKNRNSRFGFSSRRKRV